MVYVFFLFYFVILHIDFWTYWDRHLCIQIKNILFFRLDEISKVAIFCEYVLGPSLSLFSNILKNR